MPEISVVIPTHNRWHLLQRTLAGALAQEGVEVEVIVVDDGSEDETPRRLAELRDPRLIVVRNEQAQGVARARNRGLEQASGRWIAFLDDDDLWSPRKLRAQLDAPGADVAAFVYTAAVFIDTELQVLDAQRTPDPATIGDEILLRQVTPGGCANMIALTEIVREIGGFDTGFRVTEDWDLYVRILLAGEGRAACVDEFLYGYYQHGVSSVLLNREVIAADLARIEGKFAAVRRQRGLRMDAANVSRWLAQNYRRAGDQRGAARAYLRGAWDGRSLGNAARAAVMLLGEPAARRLGQHQPLLVPRPDWLALYDEGGPLASVEPSLARA